MIHQPTASDLLIAPPTIPDRRFNKSVIMLTHSLHGSTFGICVNRPTTHTLQDVLLETGIEANINFPIYWGGPMNPGTVWMLHSSEWSIQPTININEAWSMTSNIAMFHHLADGDYPQHFRIMFGFCSWARDQLRAELKGMPPWTHNHSWLVAENPGPEWLFEQPVDDLWREATELCSHQAIDSWL